MFLSSYKKQPAPPGRPVPSKQAPAAAIAGTSLSKARPAKPEPAKQSSLLPASKPQERVQDEEIIIHVCDEVKKINRDFKCPKSVLVSKMKYFEAHLQGSKDTEGLEISVHCDASIFEWLVKYMLDTAKPSLEISNVISILVSSEYLQMRELVFDCLYFMKDHLSEVVKLPIDMNCLSGNLVKELEHLVTPEELDAMEDRKDKLQSKLFSKKLESLLSDENCALSKCVYCSQLFTAQQKEWMICEKARYFVDFHGQVIAEHVPDPNWNLHKFLLYMKERGLSWREIYWRIWGRLVSFKCSVCSQRFVGADLSHCSFHPQEPTFAYGSNIGYYQCCSQEAVRFDTSISKRGCSARDHQVKNGSDKNYDLLLNKYSMSQEPFIPRTDGFLSINKLMQNYYKNTDDDFESEDEKYDDFERNKSEVKSKQRNRNKNDLNPTKQRAWKLDKLRLDDFLSMKRYAADLYKHRRKNDKPKSNKK